MARGFHMGKPPSVHGMVRECWPIREVGCSLAKCGAQLLYTVGSFEALPRGAESNTVARHTFCRFIAATIG